MELLVFLFSRSLSSDIAAMVALYSRGALLPLRVWPAFNPKSAPIAPKLKALVPSAISRIAADCTLIIVVVEAL